VDTLKKIIAPSRIALVVALTTLPIINNPAFAEKAKELKSQQAAAYLGNVSKRAISAGNLERLKTKIGNRKWSRNSGHSDADLRTRIQFWHTVALDTTALDHTTARDGEDTTSPVEQGGPTRTSRALAMVQIAVFEAVNSNDGQFNSYLNNLNANNSASVDAAVARAAFGTLTSLYPDQKERLTAIYEEDLAIISDSESRFKIAKGISFGATISARIISLRDGDASDFDEPEYGDGGAVADGTTTWFDTPVNTDDTRFIGNYWGYDGVPLIGVPPRVYNQISAQVADNQIQDPVKYARFLALINVGLADVGIAAWDSKYYYNYWRPVTGIRVDDGSDETITDVDWNPVGISVINTDEAIRPTPPFPAYPSGHAAFGASTFEIMRNFFGDDMAFTFVSDEFNGEGVDPFFPDQPRPLVPVRFESFTEAQQQNGRSRVYNGVVM